MFENGTAACDQHVTIPDPSTRNERAKRAPAIVRGRHLAAAAYAAKGRPMNYIITITLDVSLEADEQLQTPQGIEDEVRSWLTGLHADVRSITVEELS
jgi:hypothetical protein